MSVLGRGSKSFIPELIVDNERKDKMKMCLKDTRIDSNEIYNKEFYFDSQE